MKGSTPSELKAKIKREANRLGFDLVGVTTADPPDHLEVYRDWINASRHGEMGYLASPRNLERRADPKAILPECRSILVLAMNYLPKAQQPDLADPSYKVARYAQGDDYHEVIPARLEKLVEKIEGWYGGPFAYRLYTDTGPLLEREFAQRAGLGWIGKNTCLINPQKGSYYFLAEILLGLDLPPDDPITTDHCGSCTRCLEACPTSCILEDRTIDARHCISYLTIELRGAIPADLRADLDGWLFGCDICQQVCPWNQRFAQPSQEAAFQARPNLVDLQASDFMTLTEPEYRKSFSGSPLKRAKRAGLARNAAAAAGGRQDSTSLPSLRSALLNDPNENVRQHAAWALGQFDQAGATRALQEALEKEREDSVRQEIKTALARLAN